MSSPSTLAALHLLCACVIESVREAGSLGAPGGTLYAAMSAHGCTLEQFEAIMSACVDAGKLTRRGQLYYAAP